MLGYVGLGCGLLGVILCGYGLGSIISAALAISKMAKDGFENNKGGTGNQTAGGYAKQFGPLIVFRTNKDKEVDCKTVFDGLGKPYLKHGWDDTENPFECSQFDGVKKVGEECEMEFKSLCDEGAEAGNCGVFKAVASMDYPTCKKDDCPFVWQVQPWDSTLGNPTLNIGYTSEYHTTGVVRGVCEFTAATRARLMEQFWGGPPGTAILPDNTTNRRIFWASLWFLAIGIGAGIASCRSGDGAGQDEVGAELMS